MGISSVVITHFRVRLNILYINDRNLFSHITHFRARLNILIDIGGNCIWNNASTSSTAAEICTLCVSNNTTLHFQCSACTFIKHTVGCWLIPLRYTRRDKLLSIHAFKHVGIAEGESSAIQLHQFLWAQLGLIYQEDAYPFIPSLLSLWVRNP